MSQCAVVLSIFPVRVSLAEATTAKIKYAHHKNIGDNREERERGREKTEERAVNFV